MANDPGVGFEISATVTSIKGNCSAGHKVGETFAISCHDTGGLCGFCYAAIFPNLHTFQFGGNCPWWTADTIQLSCPDPHNLLVLQLKRTTRA